MGATVEVCVTSVADADFPRFDRVPPARRAPGAIFGYAAMEQTESPPVEGDVAPVEAAVEAEAVPGEAPGTASACLLYTSPSPRDS